MKLKIHDCINGNYLFLQYNYQTYSEIIIITSYFNASQKNIKYRNHETKKINHRAIAFKWQMENVLENCGTLKYSCRTERKKNEQHNTLILRFLCIIHIFFYLPTNVCLKRVELWWSENIKILWENKKTTKIQNPISHIE